MILKFSLQRRLAPKVSNFVLSKINRVILSDISINLQMEAEEQEIQEEYQDPRNNRWYSQLEEVTVKEFFWIERQFEDDECPFKLDFAFPCYRDENGDPWVLPVVRTAERVLANDRSLSKEYMSPFGYDSFNNHSILQLLGEHSEARMENRAFGIQMLSGSGAMRIGAEFLCSALGLKTVYRSQQTIEHLDMVFLSAGFTECRDIRYLHQNSIAIDIPGLLHDLNSAEERTVVFLQVCGHNPTGYDPSLEDWSSIADIMHERALFPFLYCACQGLVSGSISQDAAAVRLFEKRGLEFFCAQSLTWSFGLYNERVGSLAIVVNDNRKVPAIKSRLVNIIRTIYVTPPSHGARVVSFVLGDKMLSEQWKETLEAMADRLKRMRSYLREELERLGASGTWNHITEQVGVFCLTGLSELHVEHLKKQYHIYLLPNGRLNVSGLNPDNIGYVANAICETFNVIPRSYIIRTSM